MAYVFRIFYSTGYTLLYILCLCILAITPVSLLWTAIENSAYQYVFMIGAVYILTAILSIFIYSSRLYTNRTVLAGVGKAYIPVEEGELGRNVRKMVVRQLERSAIVAWESRPRDIEGEILQAETGGVLPEDDDVGSGDHNNYTVGRIIPVDPARPPWGRIQHAGWSSPSHRDSNPHPNVQFANVIAELPNLIEARAVFLAPPDPTAPPVDGQTTADPAVTDLLCRPETMGLHDYLTQLSLLGLINPPATASAFLQQYETARFSGRPISESGFASLMTTFATLLAGMTALSPDILAQIHAQTARDISSSSPSSSSVRKESYTPHRTPSPRPPPSVKSSLPRPVTAREDPFTPLPPPPQPQWFPPRTPSRESFASVIHRTPYEDAVEEVSSESAETASLVSAGAGSVVVRGGGREGFG